MRRPDNFTLDYSHPLAQGLVFFPVFNSKAGRPIDLVSQSLAGRFGANWGFDSIISTQNVSCVDWNFPCLTDPHGDFTFFAVTNQGGRSSAMALVGQSTSDRRTFCGIKLNAIHSSNGQTGRALSVTISSDEGATRTNLLDTEEIADERSYIGIRRNGIYELWYEGSQLSPSSQDNGTAALTIAGAGCGVGSVPLSTSTEWFLTAGVQVWQASIHNRALSSSEIAILADRTDPMLGGLVRERFPVVYFDMGAGPGPGVRYTTPYYTSNYYTFVGEDEAVGVALNSLLQSQALSLQEVWRIVGLLLGDTAQEQVLSSSVVERTGQVLIGDVAQGHALSSPSIVAQVIVVLGNLLQTNTLSPSEVRRVLSLLLGDAVQAQSLFTLDVDANLPIVVASLLQTQTLSPSALSLVLAVVINALKQDQELAALLLAGQVFDVPVGSVNQTQVISDADIVRLVATAIGSLGQSQTISVSNISGIFGVLLRDLLQGQSLSGVGLGGVVDVDLGHMEQSQVVSILEMVAGIIIEIASTHQGQTMEAMGLDRIVGVGIDHSGQMQTLHGMGVGLELILALMDLVHGQELAEGLILTAGRCFCISLSAEGKIVVTFGDVTQAGVIFGACRKPITVGFQTKTCGA